MSATWEGYRSEGRRHREKRRRIRFALGVSALVIVIGAFGIERCRPQNIFSSQAPRQATAGGGTGNPANYAVVLFNETDPLSRDLADYYAEKRGIDRERVVGLKCSNAEEISREEYDATIAGPLRAVFDERHWWTRTPDRPGDRPSSTVTGNKVRLRIRQTANYPGDYTTQPSPIRDQNGASVDSELAALGLFTRSISGVLPNPVFRSYVRFSESQPPGVMLTGRLDAPTGTMVRRMIDDALAVEKIGLWGRCYVDGRGMAPGSNPLAEGDEWMRKIATETASYNLPTVYDNLDPMFPTNFPLDPSRATTSISGPARWPATSIPSARLPCVNPSAGG